MIAEAKATEAEPTQADIARFCRYVQPDGTPGGCWQWTGHTDRKGYGQFWHNGRAVWAHRFAYAAFVGPIPDGMTIHHECANPSCVRPGHLDPATNSDNAAERHARQAEEPAPF